MSPLSILDYKWAQTIKIHQELRNGSPFGGGFCILVTPKHEPSYLKHDGDSGKYYWKWR